MKSKKTVKRKTKRRIAIKKNPRLVVRKVVYGVILLACLYMFIRCGQPGQNTSTACTPNVIANGMSLNVASLGGNAYSFQLCSASSPANAVYSVYGAGSEQDLANGFNVNAAVRSPHVSDSNQPGSTFQITFATSDSVFAIYQDADVGGVYELDNSTPPMVTAHELPGR